MNLIVKPKEKLFIIDQFENIYLAKESIDYIRNNNAMGSSDVNIVLYEIAEKNQYILIGNQLDKDIYDNRCQIKPLIGEHKTVILSSNEGRIKNITMCTTIDNDYTTSISYKVYAGNWLSFDHNDLSKAIDWYDNLK